MKPRAIVFAACGVSLALGLFFIFGWSPLPWGWHGIDFYYEDALSLAGGSPFQTMDRVWGYAYFLAGFYRLFGDRPWIPLCAQALANASIPLMIYALVRLEMSERVAVVSALVVGLFSFNTIYAATQAADAMCTVLFVAMALAFALGRSRDQRWWFAVSGLLAAVSFQFRPNLILFPFFAAACALIFAPRSAKTRGYMLVFVAAFLFAAAPWVIRNYRWSGLFVPASTHGGKQLWFGSLQYGPYRDNWLYNPRAAFEIPPLEYSSVDEVPVIITGSLQECAGLSTARVQLTYWTNRDATPRTLVAAPDARGQIAFTVPVRESPIAFSYFFETSSTIDDQPVRASTPPGGASDPLLFVVSRDHVGDLDAGGDALDIFDLVRLARHLYWHEVLPSEDRLDLDGDGRISETDLRRAAGLLADVLRRSSEPILDPVSAIDADEKAVTIRFRDGSSLSIPRVWSNRTTDLVLAGPTAQALVGRSRTFSSLRAASMPIDSTRNVSCLVLKNVEVNAAAYRRQPHEMRRFTALAIDNIRRNPVAYLMASVERAGRVFVIAGSADRFTAAQFEGGSRIYLAGGAASIVYLTLALAGLVVAIARGMRLFMILMPIA